MKLSHLADLFKYLFTMFWQHRHLPAKQALNSKGYERIIREILRRYGYFRLIRTNFTIFTYIFAKNKKLLLPFK